MSLLTQAHFLLSDKVIIKQGISSDGKQLIYGDSDKIVSPKTKLEKTAGYSLENEASQIISP